MDYVEFRAWFDKNEARLVLPADCALFLPPTVNNPTSYLWTLEWVLHFTSDNRYLRIWEHHNKVAGLIECRRVQFSFHYGPLSHFDANGKPEVDELGVPRYMSSDPVDIRIDNSCPGRRAHLHYGGPVPHYGQEQVEGMDLGKADMFRFIEAVLKHRNDGKAIAKLLGFRTK